MKLIFTILSYCRFKFHLLNLFFGPAPEVLRGEFYNHGADWWSLGVLMHALLTGSYPFGMSDSHTTMKISSYEPIDSLSPAAQMLISKAIFYDNFIIIDSNK